jgi:hypothetical protein
MTQSRFSIWLHGSWPHLVQLSKTPLIPFSIKFFFYCFCSRMMAISCSVSALLIFLLSRLISTHVTVDECPASALLSLLLWLCHSFLYFPMAYRLPLSSHSTPVTLPQMSLVFTLSDNKNQITNCFPFVYSMNVAAMLNLSRYSKFTDNLLDISETGLILFAFVMAFSIAKRALVKP